jgi:osmotically-inducible protein OsmY
MKLLRIPAMITLAAASSLSAGCGYGELVRLYFQEQEYQKDQELIARIKGALLADPQLRRETIQVEAYLGDIRLSGTISSPRQKQMAEDIAGQVDGVDSVDNTLSLRSP